MTDSNEVFDLETAVRNTTTKAIDTYLHKKMKKGVVNKHIVLDRVFPVERRIRSIIGGLETSFGMTLWEALAGPIAKSGNYNILDTHNFLMPKTMPAKIHNIISRWKEIRESRGQAVALDPYLEELRTTIQSIDTTALEFVTITAGDGLDLWIEKNGKEYAIDIKTVQINQNSGKSFSAKLMNWYAYRLLRDVEADFTAFIAFPYSPYKGGTVESWWKNNGGRATPLTQGRDALVQEEFWNLIADKEDAWDKILSVFERMGQDDWAEKYKQLFYPPE